MRLIVIGCAPFDCIPAFQKETHFTEELYCDPKRTVYKALGLGSKMVLISGHSKHVKSSALMGTLRSIWRALKSLRKQGDVAQQGGAFVLGPGNKILFQHRDAHPLDHADINKLLVSASLPEFAFSTEACDTAPKDEVCGA